MNPRVTINAVLRAVERRQIPFVLAFAAAFGALTVACPPSIKYVAETLVLDGGPIDVDPTTGVHRPAFRAIAEVGETRQFRERLAAKYRSEWGRAPSGYRLTLRHNESSIERLRVTSNDPEEAKRLADLGADLLWTIRGEEQRRRDLALVAAADARIAQARADQYRVNSAPLGSGGGLVGLSEAKHRRHQAVAVYSQAREARQSLERSLSACFRATVMVMETAKVRRSRSAPMVTLLAEALVAGLAALLLVGGLELTSPKRYSVTRRDC